MSFRRISLMSTVHRGTRKNRSDFLGDLGPDPGPGFFCFELEACGTNKRTD